MRMKGGRTQSDHGIGSTKPLVVLGAVDTIQARCGQASTLKVEMVAIINAGRALRTGTPNPRSVIPCNSYWRE
jgi:hypothetical protein